MTKCLQHWITLKLIPSSIYIQKITQLKAQMTGLITEFPPSVWLSFIVPVRKHPIWKQGFNKHSFQTYVTPFSQMKTRAYDVHSAWICLIKCERTGSARRKVTPVCCRCWCCPAGVLVLFTTQLTEAVEVHGRNILLRTNGITRSKTKTSQIRLLACQFK